MCLTGDEFREAVRLFLLLNAVNAIALLALSFKVVRRDRVSRSSE